MIQEVTIIVMVDVSNALEENTLEGNIYLMDNLRTEGSENECSPDLVTALNGTHWMDGSQASDIVINWLITGLSSLPPTLPRNYHQHLSNKMDRQALHHIKRLHAKNEKSGGQSIHESYSSILSLSGSTSNMIDDRGNMRDTNLKLMNVFGEPYLPGESNEYDLSHASPFIDDITGEAVDMNAIFPTQVGTPINLKDGWYWCATVDTSKSGSFKYVLHLTLFKLTMIDGKAVWEPVKMTYESKFKISSRPLINGFTKGPETFLPIF